jgi:signal transduction histidine kinase
LANAIKFTPDSGKVLLKARACPMDGRFRKGVKISISDTGIGMHPEDLVRIFRPFEQVERTTSRRFQGTGLGLSLTKQLVDLHGGKIWAESKGEGEGTLFHVVIPQR